METVDRLKSEKEDLEQEIAELSTRNEQLRCRFYQPPIQSS
jgi:phage shock protein A